MQKNIYYIIKKIHLLFAITISLLLFNCSKNDPPAEEVLSEAEITASKEINYEKFAGKWDFSSSSTSAKSMVTCNVNWIEFMLNTDVIRDNSYGKFNMKLDVTGGTSEFVQGYYYIRYDLTANDVPIDRVILFDTEIENVSTNDEPESGNIATFTNIKFDTQGGITFTFLPEANVSEFCSIEPVQLSAEKSPVFVPEQTIAQGVRNNLESVLGSWLFFDLGVTYNGGPVGIAEGYTHFCYWLDAETKEFCSDGYDAIGQPIVDTTCSLLSPTLNPIRLAKVTITKYGSYFLSYYDVSGVRVSLIDGTWRPWGEPDSNGNYTSIQVTKLTPGLGEGTGPQSSIWGEYEVFSIVGFDDDNFRNGTEMKLSTQGPGQYDYLDTFSLLSEGTEYSLYQCPQIFIEEQESGKF